MNNLRKIAEICNTSPCFRGKILFNEPMAAHTTFKIGGPADIFIEPADERSFIFVLSEAAAFAIPLFILGGGSNLVVSDKGIEGCVLSTASLNHISFDGSVLHCGAGCTFDEVLDFCRRHSLGGLESFAGLPGSVGGAVYMNARCYEKSISDVLVSADYICAEKRKTTADTDGTAVDAAADCTAAFPAGSTAGKIEKLHYAMRKNDWDYKKSPFSASAFSGSLPIVLSASFTVHNEEEAVIAQKCRDFIQDREKKGHFRYPSAGSVFKNNRAFGKPSGQIIDEAGLRGLRCADAQIAPWHGNFIVNLGNASADNIKELVKQIEKDVKSKTGLDLECEIIFCGR
ncbi:FAD-binding protein [Treponema sp. OMZ 840]|uniref:UDP-N-acetylmuramate dehydrogenase n=1 Tax=Treponema sp. OMZ 840 TaxID=244313 RepID=UPI003D8F4C97